MSANSSPYREGDWFAVPLRDNAGFAPGLVARMDGDGGVFGYFFGPKALVPPKLDQLCEYRASDAILMARFGDLGLTRQEWSIIGHCASWRRQDWPFPAFGRVDEATGMAWISIYDESTLEFIEEHPCDPSIAVKLPYDRMSGYGAIEIRLTKLLVSDGTGDAATAARTKDAENAGLNAAITTIIRHFLCFHTEFDAARVASALGRAGFKIEVNHIGDTRPWLVVASHKGQASEETVEKTRTWLEALAVKLGGEYDGWEFDVPEESHGESPLH